MITLKRISLEDLEANRFGEENYEIVSVHPSYMSICNQLLANVNGEGDLDTENYMYEIRED